MGSSKKEKLRGAVQVGGVVRHQHAQRQLPQQRLHARHRLAHRCSSTLVAARNRHELEPKHPRQRHCMMC